MKKSIDIPKNASLLDAIKKMVENNIGQLVVTENSKPTGILYEKDIGFYLYSNKTAQNLEQINISKVMKKIEFIDGSQTLKQCADIMFAKNIRLIAIGNENELKGIITKTDLVKYFAEHYFGKHKVVDLKNPGVVSVSTESSLSETIEKMIKNDVSRMIVTNTQNTPLGIITFRDFFAIALQLGTNTNVTEPAALFGGMRKGFLSENGFGGISIARDIMTQKIISVLPDDDLASACQIMIDNHLNGLAIVDKKERKMGIISKTDIIEFFSLL